MPSGVPFWRNKYGRYLPFNVKAFFAYRRQKRAVRLSRRFITRKETGMKIAVIADVLGKPNNGTSIATYNLIRAMKEKGHEVKVVCPDEDKKGEEGYYVAPVKRLGPLLDRIVERNGVVWAKRDDALLEKVIKDVDVVHVEMAYSLGNAAATIAKRLGKPLTASFHCQAENFTSHIFMMNSALANKITYKVFYKTLFSKCDAIHYPTQFIKDEFESQIGKKTNGVVISNGVNKEFFGNERIKKTSDKFEIVCTGRFCAEKAQSVLIEAVNKSAHKSDIKIFFAGGGPDREKLVKLAKKHGVDADFTFYDREGLKSLLLSADLYIHTATAEIEAISCLEAIVSGLVAVICNSSKSATRYFAADEKCLFKKGSSSDLAEKIDYFIENDAERIKTAKKYESMIGSFDIEHSMDEMEKMLLAVAVKK